MFKSKCLIAVGLTSALFWKTLHGAQVQVPATCQALTFLPLLFPSSSPSPPYGRKTNKTLKEGGLLALL